MQLYGSKRSILARLLTTNTNPGASRIRPNTSTLPAD